MKIEWIQKKKVDAKFGFHMFKEKEIDFITFLGND